MKIRGRIRTRVLSPAFCQLPRNIACFTDRQSTRLVFRSVLPGLNNPQRTGTSETNENQGQDSNPSIEPGVLPATPQYCLFYRSAEHTSGLPICFARPKQSSKDWNF